jgi:anti-anti-sigma regulatory factor
VLRILRRDVELDQVVLVLQGHIVAEWADVLERECEELIRTGLRVALDLAGVTYIGRASVEVLGRLGRIGVAITGCSALIADMLEQEGIAVVRDVRGTNHMTPPGKTGGQSET